jgi:hypothetical protein
MAIQNAIGCAVTGLITSVGDGTYFGTVGTVPQFLSGGASNTFGGISCALGDVISSAGSGPVAVSSGTDSYVLTCDAASANGIKWAAGPTRFGYKFLASATASASSTLDFTSSIDSTYVLYQFTLDHLIFSTASMQLGIQTSVDAGANWVTSGYIWATQGVDGSGVQYATSASDASMLMPYTTMSTTADKTTSGSVYLINPAATKYPVFNWNGQFFNGSTLSPMTGASTNPTAAAINGVRFIPTSGTITSGTIYMYGCGKPS